MNPNGRPKKIETVLKEHFLSEHNLKLSNSQVSDMVKVILGKTREELVTMAKDDTMPWWISLIANKIQRDFQKGSMHVLEVLLDRVYGKPKESVDLSGDVTIHKVKLT